MAYLGQSGGTGQVLTVSGGAPVWSNPGWFTAYEIDLTAQGSAVYLADGTYTIGGKNWVLNGIGAGVTADLSVANGLRFSGAAGYSVQAGWRTDSLNNLVSPDTFKNFSIMIWLRLEKSISQSGGTQSNFLTYISTLRAGVTWTYFGGVEWNSGTSYGAPSGLICYQAAYLGGGSNYFPSGITLFKSNYTQDNLTHDVFCYRMTEHDRLDVWSGTWAAGWPSIQSMKYRGYVSRNAQFAGGGASLQQFDLSELVTSMQINAAGATGSVTEARLKALRIQTL